MVRPSGIRRINFKFEYLIKIDFIFGTNLGCGSEDRWFFFIKIWKGKKYCAKWIFNFKGRSGDLCLHAEYCTVISIHY